MRALVLHGPGDLRLEEIPEPTPAAGEVVIRVEAALTCATDAKMLRQGRHPALPPLPAPFGHEASGTVTRVGHGVPERFLGREVCVANSAPCGRCRDCCRGREVLCGGRTYLSGAFAEELLVPAPIVAANLHSRPEGVPAALAALVEPLACAIHGADRADARPGDCVVVLGGGTQGLLVTSELARRGVDVWLCDPHENRRDRALRFGASRAFPAPTTAGARDELLAVTPDGLGADVVIEAVGRVDAWEAALAVARPGATLTFHGGCAPGTRIEIDTHALHYGERRIQGSYHHTRASVAAAIERIASMTAPYAELLGDPIDLADVSDALSRPGMKHPVRVNASVGVS